MLDSSVASRKDCWRPTVDDVDRISWGKPAKKKGTGSRGVPHRLNEDERQLYDIARRKGFLEVGGSGWRSQRREAPLGNTYRSFCDARGCASIVVHKSQDGNEDVVAVDLSPLRLPETFDKVVARCAADVAGASDAQVDGDAGVSEEALGEEEMELDSGDAWETQPIYHLAPFYVTWTRPRSEAKTLAKELAAFFETATKDKGKARRGSARKPKVKPGKSRRHGGYGIGG
mmetsp:Transcript_32916/g.104226  ORF Transcript_32916/g.104226 Transcript_32916/m.104226 type:complete len:230 (-) Transcript_32916:26-715(-)